jgi:hypothetical protein
MLFGKVLRAPRYSGEVIWLDGKRQIWTHNGESWHLLEETLFKQPDDSYSRPVQDRLFGKVSSAPRYSDEVIWLDGKRQIWTHTGES